VGTFPSCWRKAPTRACAVVKLKNMLKKQLQFSVDSADTHHRRCWSFSPATHYSKLYNFLFHSPLFQEEGLQILTSGNFGATCSNARDGYIFKLKGIKGTISLLRSEGIY
jgi:hypothetical protein